MCITPCKTKTLWRLKGLSHVLVGFILEIKVSAHLQYLSTHIRFPDVESKHKIIVKKIEIALMIFMSYSESS